MINEFVQAGVWILLPFVAGVAVGMVAMAIAVNMMREDVEEMDCERCEVVAMCRKMFGRYWNDKSAGGKGCRHPVRKDKAGEKIMEDENLAQAQKALPDEAPRTPRATAERTAAGRPSRTSFNQEVLL